MRRQIISALFPLALVGLVLTGCSNPEVEKQKHFDRGNAFVEKKAFNEAILEFRSAIQLDERFGLARYRLALAYEQAGEMNLALRETVRAADQLPDDAAVQIHATKLLVASGQYEDAAARARNVLAKDLKNVDALMLLGSAAAHLSQSDSALTTLEQALKVLPSEPRLLQSVGELQRSRGALPAAEASFKRAVDLAPKSVEARQALASYYFAVGRGADAERVLVEALPLDSGTTVSRDLAVLYFAQGRDAEAERQLLQLLATTPGDVQMRFALGDVYMRTRRFDEAFKAYEPLTAVEGTVFASASARMANADYEAGRKDAAHKRLKDALARAPKNGDLQTMSARLLLADRKFAEAESAARAALELEPDRLEPLSVLGSALAEQGRPDEALPLLRRAAGGSARVVGAQLQLARIYLERGDTDSALPYAQDAVTANPQHPLPRLILFRVLTMRSDWPRAETELRQLVRAFPNSPQTQAAVGDMAFARSDLPAARRAYSQALQLDPTAIDALAGMVQVELANKRPTEATALVDKALAANPNNGPVLLLAGREYMAAGDTKRAEEALQGVIKAAPSSSFVAYGMLASLYLQQKRLDEAKRQFESMAAKQPEAVGPATMLGVILTMQDKRKEAQAVYERLLENQPGAAVAANNLAMLLVESGQNLDVALDHAQAAKRALPNDADVNDTLGLVYLKKGLASLAVPPFEQSTKAAPKNPDFWLHLGQAYAGAGNKPKAREALNEALRVSDATFKGAADARQALQMLGS